MTDAARQPVLAERGAQLTNRAGSASAGACRRARTPANRLWRRIDREHHARVSVGRLWSFPRQAAGPIRMLRR